MVLVLLRDRIIQNHISIHRHQPKQFTDMFDSDGCIFNAIIASLVLKRGLLFVFLIQNQKF